MKKFMFKGILSTLIITIMLILSFGCADEGNKKKFLLPLAGTGEMAIVNESGGNVGAIETVDPLEQGVSDVADIGVINGCIVVFADGGKLTIGSDTLKLTEKVGELWQIVKGVEIIVKTSDGIIVEGKLVIDQPTSGISFIPTSPFDVQNSYVVVVKIGNKEYTAKVNIAVDDTKYEMSKFAGIPTYNKTGVIWISKDLYKHEKAIFGWEFPPRFRLKIQSVEPRAKVIANFYGVYEEFPNLVFYQRWADTLKPVQNWEFHNEKWMTVTEEDISIKDKSFKWTYLEFKVIDENGRDITSTTKAKINVQTLDTGLTGFIMNVKHRTHWWQFVLLGTIIAGIFGLNFMKKMNYEKS